MNKKSTVSFKRKEIKRMYRFKLDVSSFTTVNNLCIMTVYFLQIIHNNIALLKNKNNTMERRVIINKKKI